MSFLGQRKVQFFSSLCLLACCSFAIAANYHLDFVKPGFYSANITGWMHEQVKENTDVFHKANDLNIRISYGDAYYQADPEFIDSLKTEDAQNNFLKMFFGDSQYELKSKGFKKIGNLMFFTFSTVESIKDKESLGFDYYCAVDAGRTLAVTVMHPAKGLTGDNKTLVDDFLNQIKWEDVKTGSDVKAESKTTS